jgi:hypothetical protein
MTPYGKQGKEFLATAPAGECELCDAHSKAHKELPVTTCPNCGKDISHSLDRYLVTNSVDYKIVGEDNSVDVGEQWFARVPVIDCRHCGQHIALWPTPIIYNANHDVYYTGNQFSPLRDEDLRQYLRGSRIKFLVQNFVDRLKNREELTLEHVEGWLITEVEGALFKYLKDKGYKR